MMSLRRKIQNPYATTVLVGAEFVCQADRAMGCPHECRRRSFGAARCQPSALQRIAAFKTAQASAADTSYSRFSLKPGGHRDHCDGKQPDDRHPPDMPDRSEASASP